MCSHCVILCSAHAQSMILYVIPCYSRGPSYTVYPTLIYVSCIFTVSQSSMIMIVTLYKLWLRGYYTLYVPVPCRTHTFSFSNVDASPPFLQVPLGALDLERHLEWTITSSSKRPSWRWIKRESSWRSGQIRGVSMEPQNPQQTLRPSVAPPPG